MKYYLSAHDISEQYSLSMRSARTIINEIRGQIHDGRYPEMSILDGCGTRVKVEVVTDYLFYRPALTDPIASKYVKPYREEETA